MLSRTRLARIGAVLLSLWLVGHRPAAAAGEDPRRALEFLHLLRDRGLHDLALEYIDRLRADAALPADVKEVLDFEEGRTQIDEASRSSDLVRRRELLEQARARLEAFTKNNPKHPLAREAFVQVARMLVERGHLSLLMADDTADQAQKATRLAEARAAFLQGREAYSRAVEQLNQSYKGFSGFLPEGDPRLQQRFKVYNGLLDAMLQKGVADYELAQTYPQGSAERKQHLEEAIAEFDILYKNHRTEMAGMAAQMWQAKCYEEEGKIGEAIGTYKILLEQNVAELRPLQRIVGYFHIVALRKRNEPALAADEAERWLKKYSPQEHKSPEGMGVLVELAKNLDAQVGEIVDKAERQATVRRITAAANQVARYASPHKAEALALLKKHKPAAAARLAEISRLSYVDLMNQADDAISAHDWERAITLLKVAVQKADPRDIEQANRARYNLSFCYFMNKNYYEADVLAEHLARRYPQAGLSPKASEIGMQALAEAYNSFGVGDRSVDLDRLIDLARYTAAAWPDREQADDARLNLGVIYQGRGKYDQAIAEFSAVRDRSPKKLDAQARLGGAHWLKSRMLERDGRGAESAAEAQEAIRILDATLKARQAAGAQPTDPGLITNAADLAVALTETGKAGDALALLEPIGKAQTARTGAPFARLMEATLLAQINAGQIEPAIASMKALEQSGTTTGRAQLYYKLGKLLEKELERLREKKDDAGLSRTQQAYRSFLTALTESKSGQTYESLQWAGESLISLGAGADAEKVLQRVLNESITDPAFLSQPGGQEKVLQTKLKLATALRLQGSKDKRFFDKASSLLDEVQSQNPRYIEPLFERGMLLEAQAEAGKGSWPASTGTGGTWTWRASCRGCSRGPSRTMTPGITRPWPCSARKRTPRRGRPYAAS
ncbi:MAG: tetratricopeptide repeat protein [Isosphaeraceae bacterium]